MNTFLRDLALAHQRHEGYFPGSRSYRNNNPGNLRAGPPSDDKAFTIFPTYEAGFNAMKYDLKVKILGLAGSVRRYMEREGKTYDQLVFQEYVAIYAPSADSNNPVNYCNQLCLDMKKYNLSPSTPLSVMAELVVGLIDRVPDPPSPEIPLEKRLEIAKNALRWASPERQNMLRRLIERIKKRLNIS